MKPWIFLVVAGLLEVVWATSMKYTDGFTRLRPSLLTLAGMVASFALLARAMMSLPLGVAYAVWVGIGATGAAVTGAVLLGERLSPVQVVCLVAIAGGIVGLKVTTPADAGGRGTPIAPVVVSSASTASGAVEGPGVASGETPPPAPRRTP